jgi:hypothetical protein
MRLERVPVLLGGVALLALSTAFCLPAARAAGQDTDPDVTEVRQYQLTLDKAQKAATAVQSINQLIASNPSLSAALNASADSTSQKSITQQAQDVDSKYPQVSAIIKQNGLASREFIVLIGAIVNDVGIVGMKKQGMVQTYPPGMITPQNAALIEANWDAFQAIAAKMTPPSSN